MRDCEQWPVRGRDCRNLRDILKQVRAEQVKKSLYAGEVVERINCNNLLIAETVLWWKPSVDSRARGMLFCERQPASSSIR
jgi:hypothetical protein